MRLVRPAVSARGRGGSLGLFWGRLSKRRNHYLTLCRGKGVFPRCRRPGATDNRSGIAGHGAGADPHLDSAMRIDRRILSMRLRSAADRPGGTLSSSYSSSTTLAKSRALTALASALAPDPGGSAGGGSTSGLQCVRRS